MDKIDKMARELLPDELCLYAYEINDFSTVVSFSEALNAVREALLIAPPGMKLVPADHPYKTKDNATGAGDLEKSLRGLLDALEGTPVADYADVAIAKEALERYDPSHTEALEKSLRDLNQEYERVYAALKQSQVSAPTSVHVMRNGELFWDISSPVFDTCGRLIAGHVTNGAWEVELDHQNTLGRVKDATDWFPIGDLSYVMVYPKELPEDPTEDNTPF